MTAYTVVELSLYALQNASLDSSADFARG